MPLTILPRAATPPPALPPAPRYAVMIFFAAAGAFAMPR